MQKLIPKSMHFLLLEMCVDSWEKTTLNQPQIMEEKKCQQWELNAVPSASKADMLTNSLPDQW